MATHRRVLNMTRASQEETAEQLTMILSSLSALAVSLNQPLAPSDSNRHRQMATDLSSYPLQEVIRVLKEWRTGELTVVPRSDLRFFPCTAQVVTAIRTIREEAEKEALDQIAADSFAEVLEAVRKHGPELRPSGGHIVRTRDDDGRLLEIPVRTPRVAFPGFSTATERALTRMGWGDRARGLQVLLTHPLLLKEPALDAWAVKNGELLEKKWRECCRYDPMADREGSSGASP